MTVKPSLRSGWQGFMLLPACLLAGWIAAQTSTAAPKKPYYDPGTPSAEVGEASCVSFTLRDVGTAAMNGNHTELFVENHCNRKVIFAYVAVHSPSNLKQKFTLAIGPNERMSVGQNKSVEWLGACVAALPDIGYRDGCYVRFRRSGPEGDLGSRG